MAISYKILGQAAPADTNNANLYTVPSATETIVSSLHIANVTGSPATFRVYVRDGGAAAADGNAWAKDVELARNSVFSAIEGLTLSAGDIITVQTGTANALTFQLFGSELS